jgi:hypothetical protein
MRTMRTTLLGAMLGVALGLTGFPGVARAADLCEKLTGHKLWVDGNGFQGTTGVLRLEPPDKAGAPYEFHTALTMTGEPPDPVSGTCKDRHLQFTRSRSGSFVQKYDGWIFEKSTGVPTMAAGTFEHGGTPDYGWYAKTL